MRRTARIAGTVLVAAGGLTLAWTLVVWRWQEPFTGLYTKLQQHRLAAAYERRADAFRPHPVPDELAALRREVARDAQAYRASLTKGGPVGRLRIGRIGLDMVVVQGTDHDSLEKGPGHYLGSDLPGQGELVYIAGHRTTYLAPFAHIDDIQRGDWVAFELPYGTFDYRVTGHRVVKADDTSVLRSRHRDVLILQACHPRFFASHRYLVYASLRSFAPTGGRSVPAVPGRLAAAG